jgi:hypothetical protein
MQRRSEQPQPPPQQQQIFPTITTVTKSEPPKRILGPSVGTSLILPNADNGRFFFSTPTTTNESRNKCEKSMMLRQVAQGWCEARAKSLSASCLEKFIARSTESPPDIRPMRCIEGNEASDRRTTIIHSRWTKKMTSSRFLLGCFKRRVSNRDESKRGRWAAILLVMARKVVWNNYCKPTQTAASTVAEPVEAPQTVVLVRSKHSVRWTAFAPMRIGSV